MVSIATKKWLSLVGLIALVVFPFVNRDPFTLFIFTVALLWAVAGLYLNLLVGYGGVFFISPMVFIAVAGYASGWLSLAPGSPACPTHSGCLGLHPFVTIIIGAAFAVIFSFPFSLVSTRLKGLYMALYSVIFTLFLGAIASQFNPLIFYWTGGPGGLSQLPDIVVGGFEFRSLNGVAYYYLELSVLVVAALILSVFLKSKFGLAMRSLRDAEEYSSTLGVNSLKVKVLAFMIAAFFMGIAGGIWVHFFSSIQPGFSNTSWVVFFLGVLFFGGIGTFVGPIVGSFVLVSIDQNLTIFGPWRHIILGVAVLAVLLVAPEGIVGRIQRSLAARRGKGVEAVHKVLLQRATDA